MEDDYGMAMSYLEAGVSVNGVASIKFRDGELFMFNKATIERLLAAAEKSEQDRVVVFVKTGPILSKETLA